MAYEDGSYRIRAGTHTAADMTAAYAVKAFPAQADQGSWKWFNPVGASGALAYAAEYVDSLDGGRKGFGGYQCTWTFGGLTPDMVAYLRSTFFSAGYSAPVTIMTWDRQYGWRVLNCTARWNDPATNAEPGGRRGYLNVTIDFINGVEADAE